MGKVKRIYGNKMTNKWVLLIAKYVCVYTPLYTKDIIIIIITIITTKSIFQPFFFFTLYFYIFSFTFLIPCIMMK
jgi:hypothetical protein